MLQLISFKALLYLNTCIIFHEIMFFKELSAFRALYSIQSALIIVFGATITLRALWSALFFLHSAFPFLHSAFLMLHSAFLKFSV